MGRNGHIIIKIVGRINTYVRKLFKENNRFCSIVSGDNSAVLTICDFNIVRIHIHGRQSILHIGATWISWACIQVGEIPHHG